MDDRLFAGTPYRAVRRIQGRPFTEIYEVDGPHGRSLAKVLRSEWSREASLVDRMRLEAEILAALSHPNIVRLADFGRTGTGRPYLVLERLVGRTLRRELTRRGALPAEEAAGLIAQALDGIAEVHRLGVVHRDIKPDNLFLAIGKQEPTLKILDFGFAKVLPRRRARVRPLAASTEDEAFLGTHRYVAPEQLGARQRVDHRTDIYAFGLVLYALSFGREPFHLVQDRRDLLEAHREQPLDPPSSQSALRIPRELIEVIERATAKKREHRFESATVFAAALRAFSSRYIPPQPRGHRRERPNGASR